MPPKKPRQPTIFPCHWCGKALPKGRRDMKFHDSNCRMAYKRWKDKMSRAVRDAKRSIETIAGYLPYDDTREIASKRLVALTRYMNQAWGKLEENPEREGHAD